MPLTLRLLDGTLIPSGSMNNVFGDVRAGSGMAYAYVQVVNETPGTLSAQRVSLGIDPGGCAVSVAVADGTARASGYTYGTPAIPGSWSMPTTYAACLALPDLAAGRKCLVAIRRDSAGASPAYPENNRLIIQSTGSI